MLSGGGLMLLGVAMGLAALSHAKPDLGLGELAETVDLIGSVAATSVPLGFSIHGVRCGLGELQAKRATGYGGVLLVMSLIGLVAAYQLGTQAVRALLG